MEQEKEISEEELKKKAEVFQRRVKEMSNTVAKTFEDWLETHKNAGYEEQHEKLAKFIEAGIMASHVTLAIML